MKNLLLSVRVIHLDLSPPFLHTQQIKSYRKGCSPRLYCPWPQAFYQFGESYCSDWLLRDTSILDLTVSLQKSTGSGWSSIKSWRALESVLPVLSLKAPLCYQWNISSMLNC